MSENKKRSAPSRPPRTKSPARPDKKPAPTADQKPGPIADRPALPVSRPQKAFPKPRTTPAASAKPVRTTKTGAVKSSPPSAKPGLSILMVASEAHPYAKTGGLAEVAAALPDALGRLGHRVTLVVPRYHGVDVSGSRSQITSIQLGARVQQVVFHTREERTGVTAVFVDVPELFDRPGGLYNVDGVDYPDNPRRFAVFSRAALEYPRLAGERPSIIHAHDWQTGLVPVYQKMHLSPDPIVGGVPAIFTIHNLAFQGLTPASALPSIGLGLEMLDVQAMEFWGQISYLKGGINFSERLTTVSPTYAREILTPEFGFGFDGVLRRRADALTGILNGIDIGRWNPEKDEFIGATYSARDLSGKAIAKRGLLETVGLGGDDGSRTRPVIGVLSRLTDQKGFDLVAAAVDDLMALDASWVMLGSGDRKYEDLWRALAVRYPRSVSATIGFDEGLAHRIEAGSDLFLMPSRYEPCGLNQMYSLRYGTVPIVRATGGLDDTVVDVAQPGGNGFKFKEYSPAALVAAVRRALDLFRKPNEWKKIQQNGMKQDFSWDASAREYVKVYEAAQAAARKP
jgi:starch synthase